MSFSSSATYDVTVAPHLLDPENHLLAEALGEGRGVLVVDAKVHELHGAAIAAYAAAHLPGYSTHLIDGDEAAKSIETVLELCRVGSERGLGRADTLVAIGGGVCSDVVSVAATLMRRGLPYVTVPTTLLGQVDAGIALKGGVNFSGHKNALGSFRPPSSVFVDIGFLQTLPARELAGGLAEIVKIALVRDVSLVELLAQAGPTLVTSGFAEPVGVGTKVVERSIALMLDELALNPLETLDLPRLADFGHTVSPRLEELSGWRLRHGEAVAVDMGFSAALSAELGLLRTKDLNQIVTLLSSLGLPTTSPLLTAASARDAMSAAVTHRRGRLNIVLPVGLGEATFIEHLADVSEASVEAALVRLLEATQRLGDRASTSPVQGLHAR